MKVNYLSVEINHRRLCWVTFVAVLYTLGETHIGAHAVISQKGYLCTGSHDYTSAHFDINAADCYMAEKCWLATDVFCRARRDDESPAPSSARAARRI